MADVKQTTHFRSWLWLIRIIGVIVPRRLRADWRQEWEAELQHRELLLADWDRLDWRSKLNLLWRSSSAFWDALWLLPRRWEDEMFQDVRYGVRMLLRSKAFTTVAVLSLALGIGANTALFSVVDAVMLKALPVDHPEQLVLLRWVGGSGIVLGFRGSTEKDMATGLKTSTSISYPAFERFRDQNQTLASIFAFAPLGQLNLNVDGQAEVARVQAVSGNYFSGLGVPARLGRTLTNEDEKAGAAPTAVISDRYFQRRFGGDGAVIGKVVYLNGTAFTIVGVTPPKFFGTLDVGSVPDLTVTMGMISQVSPRYAEYQRSATNWWMHIMGRLKAGVDATQVQAELTTILQRHVMELPAASGDQIQAPQIRLSSGSQGLVEQRRRFSTQFGILMAIVGLVLLIACVNLATLLLARAATRQKELAVRVSVGASRLRLIRQLLIESLLLAALGGGLGLLFAYWGKDALVALLMGKSDELAIALTLDWRVLGFTTVVSLLTGLLFGLAPALRATRLELTPMLKENLGSSGPSRSRLSKALVVAQVAMSLLLLVGAGLFVRTLNNLNQIDAGFNRENLLIFSVNPRYETTRRANLYQQMTEQIAALPGVRAVSSSQFPLLAGSYSSIKIDVPGYTPQANEEMKVRTTSVAPQFLATMEIPLLMGRELTPQDNQSAPRVVVVSQALAQRFFPHESPLSQRIILDGESTQIVGVARDTKYGGIREAIEPVVYLPYLQNHPGPPAEMSFAVRTQGDATAAIAAIRQAVHSIDRNLPLFDVRLQSEVISRSFAQARLFATLSSFFGLLALALVSIGLYGLMSYTIARRTHEIGIRMALGARRPHVLRIVLGESLLLVLIGSLIGLAAALAATRLIAGMLFGLTPNNPLIMALATLLLLAVAALACWLPARRAARVDPLVALRYE
jgi:predicted permease